MATDEIKARRALTVATRAVRPAQVLPELVEDDFDSTAPQQAEELVTTIVSRGTVYGPHPTETLYPAAVKTARRLEHQG